MNECEVMLHTIYLDSNTGRNEAISIWFASNDSIF